MTTKRKARFFLLRGKKAGDVNALKKLFEQLARRKPSPVASASPATLDGRIVGVHDGDTITVLNGSRWNGRIVVFRLKGMSGMSGDLKNHGSADRSRCLRWNNDV